MTGLLGHQFYSAPEAPPAPVTHVVQARNFGKTERARLKDLAESAEVAMPFDPRHHIHMRGR